MISPDRIFWICANKPYLLTNHKDCHFRQNGHPASNAANICTRMSLLLSDEHGNQYYVVYRLLRLLFAKLNGIQVNSEEASNFGQVIAFFIFFHPSEYELVLQILVRFAQLLHLVGFKANM